MSADERNRSLVDEMIRSRMESTGDTEAQAVQSILARVADLPDDTPMIMTPGGDAVDARTIRVWASFYRTPEKKQ
jgi:hypothetical protein